MPLIVTPIQLSLRSEFYHQLSQLTSAGLGLHRALDHLEKHPPARSFRVPIRQIQAGLAAGNNLSESLQHLNRWLPDFDLALLRAGEESGRLDTCFLLLSRYYSDRARIARQLLTDLAYPMFVLHFAVFILPFPELFSSGNVGAYMAKTLGLLIPCYVLVFVGLFAAQGRHGERWRSIIETLLDPVPLLGRGRYETAVSRLALALEALISAGVTIVEAWMLAGAASGSPRLNRTVKSWRMPLREGATPADLVTGSRRFPLLFTSEYTAAEISGNLDQTLKRLGHYYQEEGTRRISSFARWTPRLIYLLVALAIAYKVIQFYVGYFKMVGDAINF